MRVKIWASSMASFGEALALVITFICFLPSNEVSLAKLNDYCQHNKAKWPGNYSLSLKKRNLCRIDKDFDLRGGAQKPLQRLPLPQCHLPHAEFYDYQLIWVYLLDSGSQAI